MLSQSTKATMYSCIQLHVPQTPLSFFSNKKHTFDSCITSDAASCNLCMHSSKSKIKVENQTIKKKLRDHSIQITTSIQKSKYLPNTHEEVHYNLRLLPNYSSMDNIPCCKINLKKKGFSDRK